ncbi:MAG TPA: 16S rRNA (guanine(527)-N(7))-methyltransferase RsmG [Anaerolineales bacterium]|nr:16S rRNA (guanine(527)-N(7))-methyltransferase RsmG [Anaerolineales bacterium]
MDELVQAAQKLFGIHLAGRQVAALATLENELLAWNQKFNLTAIREPEGIRTKHFLDSFSCVLAWKDRPPARLIDVGTGAGFPGIPLKILYPAMHLTLVESVGKKAAFCRHVVELLKLEGVEVITGRAEELGQMPARRESCDWAVARAVANMPVLAEYLLPLVRVGGKMLAQKGHNAPMEAHNAEPALNLLGGQISQLIPVTLPGVAEEHYLVVVDKVAATPSQYPRKPGFPAKQPLI